MDNIYDALEAIKTECAKHIECDINCPCYTGLGCIIEAEPCDWDIDTLKENKEAE